MRRRIRPRATRLLVLLLLAAGCASYRTARFGPSPLQVSVVPEEGEAAMARALFAFQGVGDVETEAGEAPALGFRLRLENTHDEPLALATDELLLVDAGLQPFGPPRVELVEGEEGEIPPGGKAVFELHFPFPAEVDPEDLDLSGVNLRWALRVGGQLLVLGTTFERMERAYPPPYYHDPFFLHDPFFYSCHPRLGWHLHGYYHH